MLQAKLKQTKPQKPRRIVYDIQVAHKRFNPFKILILNCSKPTLQDIEQPY